MSTMLEKEFENRKDDIRESLEELLEAELKITEWDVPEADEQKAKQILLNIFQEKLDEMKKAVKK